MIADLQMNQIAADGIVNRHFSIRYFLFSVFYDREFSRAISRTPTDRVNDKR